MTGLEQDTLLIRELAKFVGKAPSALARDAGLADTTISRPYAGTATSRLSTTTIDKLRERYPNFPGWHGQDAALSEGRSEYRHDGEPARSPEYRVGKKAAQDDIMAIPMLEFGYGMGGTFLDTFDQPQKLEHFPRAFIRMFTNAPADQLACTYGIGDSMEPTIGDRDPILFDRSRQFIRVTDQIWVLSVGGIGMVKRVRIEGGRTVLISDNDRVPDYIVGDEELHIIGRVVAVVRRL